MSVEGREAETSIKIFVGNNMKPLNPEFMWTDVCATLLTLKSNQTSRRELKFMNTYILASSVYSLYYALFKLNYVNTSLS